MLPRSYLDTTVAIENAYSDGDATRFRTIGTGFFIGLDYGDRLPSGADTYRLLMVTNRHVIAGKDDVVIRVNRHGGTVRHLRLPLTGAEGRTWAAHPDERVDIAVVLTNARVLADEGLDFNYFRQPDIAFSSTMKELAVGPGQELFILGFPMGLTGVDRNYVIARAGMIARFDDELLASSRTFLIDATMFPGNSGGPVIIKPTSDRLEGSSPVDRAYLVGVVRSYLPYEEVAYSLQTEPPTARVVFIENSGLADVIPMDCVREAADALAMRIAQAPAATVVEADTHAGNGAG